MTQIVISSKLWPEEKAALLKAPEVIASADEFCHEDNPDYLTDEKEKADKTKEFDRTIIVQVDLPFDAVVAILNPKPPSITGTIVPRFP